MNAPLNAPQARQTVWKCHKSWSNVPVHETTSFKSTNMKQINQEFREDNVAAVNATLNETQPHRTVRRCQKSRSSVQVREQALVNAMGTTSAKTDNLENSNEGLALEQIKIIVWILDQTTAPSQSKDTNIVANIPAAATEES